MKISEVLEKLYTDFPAELACEWDNTGLLVGGGDADVTGIFVALDATTEVIEEAKAAGANLIITHHPLIFKGLKKITADDFLGGRIVMLLKNGMSCIAMHTNFDVAKMAELVAEKFPYKSWESLDEEGIGSIGELDMSDSSICVCELAELVKEEFSLEGVNVFGDVKRAVKKLAIVPGSGHSDIDIAALKGADCLLTGDISHHEGIDAVEKGICVIDAGHYGLEQVFIPYMEEYCKKNFADVNTEAMRIEIPITLV